MEETLEKVAVDAIKNFDIIQFVLLCLTVYAITFVVRLSVEGCTSLFEKTKNFKNSPTWREWLLKVLPIVLGALFALFAKHFPYPIMLEYASGRMGMGAVAGLLASMVYAKIKKKIKANKDDSDEDVTPQPPVS